jgi:hypothetical protein
MGYAGWNDRQTYVASLANRCDVCSVQLRKAVRAVSAQMRAVDADSFGKQ